MMSAGNMDRLVAKLSRMRGAALKLGQMISFQGRSNHSINEFVLRLYRCKDATGAHLGSSSESSRQCRLHARVAAG